MKQLQESFGPRPELIPSGQLLQNSLLQWTRPTTFQLCINPSHYQSPPQRLPSKLFFTLQPRLSSHPTKTLVENTPLDFSLLRTQI